MRWAGLLVLAGLSACEGDEKAGPGPWLVEDRGPDTGPLLTDADTADTGERGCGDAVGEIPVDAVTIQWDDGEGYTELEALDWSAEGVELADTEAYEAVRFDINRPARILGFTVDYGVLPEGDDTPVMAGLYEDFGHNGFVFWRF